MTFLDKAKLFSDELVEMRRHIHQYPEIGMSLPKTTEFVMNKLKEIGLEPEEIIESGITATIGGKKPGKTLLIRADMDALPIHEASGEEFLSIIAMVLIMKWIIKPDIKLLRDITVEKLNREALPPMNRIQWIISLSILIFILAMLFPVVFGNNPLAELLQNNIHGIAMTIVAVLALITVKGEAVLPFNEVMKNNFSWPTYLIIATSLLLGDALTSEKVGFTALLENLLSPVFQDMNIVALTILAVLIGVLTSNVLNSVVVVLILQPIIYTYSQIHGMDVTAVIALMTFSTIGSAAITPSASPYAATIFAQRDYVTPLEVYKFTSLFVLAETIILLVIGLPLANLLF